MHNIPAFFPNIKRSEKTISPFSKGSDVAVQTQKLLNYRCNSFHMYKAVEDLSVFTMTHYVQPGIIWLTLTSRELLNPPCKAVWISSHRLWTPPPSYRTHKKTDCIYYVVFTATKKTSASKAMMHFSTSVSIGNRFFSEQGIFTDTSSHASLNLVGYGTGTSPSLRRSVCSREIKWQGKCNVFTGYCCVYRDKDWDSSFLFVHQKDATICL